MVNFTVIAFPFGQEDRSPEDIENIFGFPSMIEDITIWSIYGSFAFGIFGTLFGIPMSDVWIMTNSL